MLTDNLSAVIKSKAIRASNGELAWKKDDVFEAVEEIFKLNYAILGGDVWGLSNRSDIPPLSKTIDFNKIIIGILPCKNGEKVVFNWYSTKKNNEMWSEFISRSKQETIRYINEMKAEDTVVEEFKDSIYYCLVFTSEVEYQKLG